MSDEWAARRHMLSEHCDGCGRHSEQVFGLDLPLARMWLCRSCWVSRWRAMPGAKEVLWTGVGSV